MDRRNFLRTLAAGLVSPLLDVERLLWIPGAKTIFVPSLVAAPVQSFSDPELGKIMAQAWMNIVGYDPIDNIFEEYSALRQIESGARFAVRL